jgi:5-methylcytosine-specific restriction protein A
MKLANFKRFTTQGGGLLRGGKQEKDVWDRFSSDRDALLAAVIRIRAAGNPQTAALPPEEDEGEAVEGRILFREHRVRERDRELVNKTKSAAMRRHGRLACEVCHFDFSERYGLLGADFIECHHTIPLASSGARVTKSSDLALVCSNCHRMLHCSHEPLTIAALRELIAAAHTG